MKEFVSEHSKANILIRVENFWSANLTHRARALLPRPNNHLEKEKTLLLLLLIRVLTLQRSLHAHAPNEYE